MAGASVAREVAGAAFGDGVSGPRNAAALDNEASACVELASRKLSGRPHLPCVFWQSWIGFVFELSRTKGKFLS